MRIRTVKAHVEHDCDRCGGVIFVGDLYELRQTFPGGAFTTEHICDRCSR